MLSQKTFETFHDSYETGAVKCHLHRDQTVMAKHGPIKCLRLVVFEIDGSFLTIRTDVWGDFARQEIDIFETLDDAIENVELAEEEFAD